MSQTPAESSGSDLSAHSDAGLGPAGDQDSETSDTGSRRRDDAVDSGFDTMSNYYLYTIKL